ncbi:expressed unknown protein (Partial), partial [Seminavis robusta]
DRAPPSSISSNKARHDSDGNHDKKPPAKKTTKKSSKKQAPRASFPSTSDDAPVTPVAPDDVGNEPAHSEEKKAKEVDPSGGEEQNDMTETDKAFFRSMAIYGEEEARNLTRRMYPEAISIVMRHHHYIDPAGAYSNDLNPQRLTGNLYYKSMKLNSRDREVLTPFFSNDVP